MTTKSKKSNNSKNKKHPNYRVYAGVLRTYGRQILTVGNLDVSQINRISTRSELEKDALSKEDIEKLLIKPSPGQNKDIAYLSTLEDSTDLSSLSYLCRILCSSKSMQIGNVCVALAAIGDTVYFASNTNDHKAGNIESLKEKFVEEYPESKLFFDVFQTTVDSRESILGSSHGRDVNKEIYKEKKVDFKDLTDAQIRKKAKKITDNINKLLPPRAKDVNIEFDSILSDYCDIVQQWNYIPGVESDTLTRTSVCIELFAMQVKYTTSDKKRREMKSVIDHLMKPLIRYTVYQLLLKSPDPRITTAATALIDAFTSVQQFFPESDICKISERLDNLKTFKRFVLVKSNEVGAVLHCEIKLYNYLISKYIRTGGLPFYISKPLCMDCSMWFYTKVKESERPQFHGACLDHFSGTYCYTPCADLNHLFSNHVVTHRCTTTTRSNHDSRATASAGRRRY